MGWRRGGREDMVRKGIRGCKWVMVLLVRSWVIHFNILYGNPGLMVFTALKWVELRDTSPSTYP